MRFPKTTATYFLSVALLGLAASLSYFTFTLTRIANDIPVLLEGIRGVERGLDPVIGEIAQVRQLIPIIVDEVGRIRQEIPHILDEIEGIREQLPAILDEAAKYRMQIPAILSEIEEIRNQIPPILDEATAYRLQLPTIVEQIEALRLQIPPIVEEVQKIRESMVPDILAETQAIREAVPGYLDKVQQLTEDIETAGRKASEGAVQGVFTGIIKAPASIVASLGSNILTSKTLSEEERRTVYEAVESLVENGGEGDHREWKNRSTGLKGDVVILSSSKIKGRQHLVVGVKAFRRLKKILDDEMTISQEPDGTWSLEPDQ